MIIAVDFDGTIVEHMFPKIGPLLPGAVKCLSDLYEAGHKIIIWTCRTGREAVEPMVDFLHGVGVRFHSINSNLLGEIDFNPIPKVYADIYIDDHNLFHQANWESIREELFSLKVL